jgi:hypothetical protein
MRLKKTLTSPLHDSQCAGSGSKGQMNRLPLAAYYGTRRARPPSRRPFESTWRGGAGGMLSSWQAHPPSDACCSHRSRAEYRLRPQCTGAPAILRFARQLEPQLVRAGPNCAKLALIPLVPGPCHSLALILSNCSSVHRQLDRSPASHRVDSRICVALA